MICDFASLAKYAELSSLDWSELSPNAALNAMQISLYASYMLLAPRGMEFVRDIMIADIVLFLDLGARSRAHGILWVLRRFYFDHPEIEAPPAGAKSAAIAGSKTFNLAG